MFSYSELKVLQLFKKDIEQAIIQKEIKTIAPSKRTATEVQQPEGIIEALKKN